MRNLLALFGLVVLVFGGAGWYMGWYKLSVSRGTEGNLEIKTDVDTKKVAADSSEALKNLGAVIGNHVEKAAQDAKATTPTGAPGGTPGPVTPPQNPMLNPLVPPAPTTPVSPDTSPVLPVSGSGQPISPR